MNYAHTPVMLNECLSFVSDKDNVLFVDANTGEGGHSFAFLYRFHKLKVVCIDVDNVILEIAKKRLEQFSDRTYFYNEWSYDFFTGYPSELKRPDYILFDLGISFFHYKLSARGFSFEKNEFLDMRLDTKESGLTAADLVARLPEKELADLIYNNSGERFSRRIASFIACERQNSAITTTSALADLVQRAVPASYRHGPIHPATRTFQALRIAVNGELSGLHALLEAAFRSLEHGGKLLVISFHSLEDRIVKNFIKALNKNCICPQNAPICNCRGLRSANVLTKKGITPSKEELAQNPPSRSARLRVIEKISDGDSND
ncbi:MAG: 16S rRNA (cytosine(1402)-N(4))-methyltransferase RsmH [Treponema sp.]|nr:16S rRNA (cytosine(1402)-N(4))-methyltransferase RsmH [Treponema sp.]